MDGSCHYDSTTIQMCMFIQFIHYVPIKNNVYASKGGVYPLWRSPFYPYAITYQCYHIKRSPVDIRPRDFHFQLRQSSDSPVCLLFLYNL